MMSTMVIQPYFFAWLLIVKLLMSGYTDCTYYILTDPFSDLYFIDENKYTIPNIIIHQV